MAPWRVETECPQCGAPVTLGEAQHILCCPYCKTNLYLIPRGPFRYAIHAKKPSENAVYLPYWRIKGLGFTLYLPPKVTGKPVDRTFLATSVPIRTVSLGIRPQAIRLYFAHTSEARFFPIQVDLKQALERTLNPLDAPVTERETVRKERNLFLSGVADGDPFDRLDFTGGLAFETRTVYKKYEPVFSFLLDEGNSLVYFPVIPEGGKSLRLRDGVTGTPVGEVERDRWNALRDQSVRSLPAFATLPLLCPNCGWELDYADESWAVACRGCHQIWGISQGRYVSLPYEIGEGGASDALYLPFWKFETAFPELALYSLQDLARFANLTRHARATKPFAVFVPAFKVRPRLMIQICKVLTVAQPETHPPDRIPREIYPVLLSARNVRGMLPLVMGEIGANKEEIFPRLSGIEPVVTKTTLAFLPFRKTGYDAVFQGGAPLSIPVNALKWGRKL